jgi:T-complex protein 1 subunit theta
MGLHPSDILSGFEKAYRKTEEIITELVSFTLNSTTDKDEIVKVLKPVLGSKIYGCEDILAPIVADACITTVEDG